MNENEIDEKGLLGKIMKLGGNLPEFLSFCEQYHPKSLEEYKTFLENENNRKKMKK